MMLHSGKADFEFFQCLLTYEQQSFQKLQEDCIRKGVLFEDDLFQANFSSYNWQTGRSQPKHERIEWLRPSQIVANDATLDFIHTNNSNSTKRCKTKNSATTFRNQFNFLRGHNGCSNFLSALPILFSNEVHFAHVVPNDQSFNSTSYAGIFHFRIWQFGKWYDIVVDDRLPTLNGQLLQVHSFNHTEFWPALLEKAFAKLNGCYQSLHGCDLEEFIEDMTGGLCESINAYMPVPLNEGLFETLYKSLQVNSHVLVRVLEEKTDKHKPKHSCAKRQLPNGLIRNQSYIVLQAKVFEHSEKTFHLIKLCNPWKRLNQIMFSTKRTEDTSNSSNENERGGLNDGKWNGSWSENSAEWINLSDEVKGQFGLLLDCDSHFWMPIENFVETFTDVTITHYSVELLKNSAMWNSVHFHGYWISGVSAGGCYHEVNFHQNPTYVVPIHAKRDQFNSEIETASATTTTPVEVKSVVDSKESSGSLPAHYTLLVGLMQKYRSSKRRTGIHDLKIGFHLFKLEAEDRKYIQEVIYDDYLVSNMQSKANYEKVKVRLKMMPEFFHVKKGEQALKFFSNAREVTARYKLTDGDYLVLPSTYGPNCDGNFLLRFYCDIPFRFVDKSVLDLNNDNSSETNVESKHTVRMTKTFSDRMFSRPLEKIANYGELVDVEHLEMLLKSVTTSTGNYFNLDQCQALLSLYDLDCKGTLSYVQLEQLCVDIDECYQLFLRHDKTVSRSISSSELKAVLVETGINANSRVIEMLVNRYGSKVNIVVKGVHIRELKFTNFTLCLLKLRKTLIYWDIKFQNSSLASKTVSSPSVSDTRTRYQENSCNFTLVEFVKQIIYS